MPSSLARMEKFLLYYNKATKWCPSLLLALGLALGLVDNWRSRAKIKTLAQVSHFMIAKKTLRSKLCDPSSVL